MMNIIFRCSVLYLVIVCISSMVGQQQDPFGRSALHVASDSGCVRAVRILVSSGADINQQDFLGMTALHWAAVHGHEEVISLLVRAGADIDRQDVLRRSALHWAVVRGNADIVRMLIDVGANVAQQDSLGRSALHWAVVCGNSLVIRMLLEAGAHVGQLDVAGRTALHWAALRGDEGIVRMLTDAGADVNQQDYLARVALSCAAENGHESIVRLLVSIGTHPHFLCVNQHRGGADTCTVSIRNYLLSVPTLAAGLQDAVDRGDLSAVDRLVVQGAPLLFPDSTGNTPLYSGIREYNPREPSVHDEIMRVLIRAVLCRVRYIKNKYGQTLLHVAIARGNVRIARYLLAHRADVNMQDNYGNTPLHYVQSKRMRDLLLEYHADPTVENYAGQVPMAYNPRAWNDLLYAYT
jgi:ankyrin repeat protein